ncbi:unnamed protein product [Porites evermanni]|uniref:F5/8 type C domain-containing protein n=1 Tax=Porites evermanni TaxID=104178 RepID=A0ABN8LPH3_9CNID|nr:unnamed protein product [Porites evermanni]
MLKNQLALTEGLRANQRSNTHGFSQLERFADMRELPGAEATEDEDDYKTAASSIKFNPPLKLDPGFRHFLAIDRLSMTYSWYNIRSDYNNNTIKYTHDGTTWQTITFTDGMYSYSDINDYIHQYMDQKCHHSTDSKGAKVYSINLTFILSTYRVLLSIDGDYQLDLRGTNFLETDLKRNL